jgi:enoyl-CoA hydratase
MTDILSYQLHDSVANIVLDDGKVNVLSPRMQARINAALDQAVADKAVVLLTGRAGVFSAGFDLAVLKAGGEDAGAMLRGGFQLAERLLSFPTPVVIACTGHALAMGVFLVLSADYRIGAEGPFKIGANEVAIGMTLPLAALEICRQKLAPAHLNRAVLNAEIYTPRDAVMAGFLDRVVPAEELSNLARQAAVQLTKLDMTAHAASKLRLREQMLKSLHAAIDADDAAFRERRNN